MAKISPQSAKAKGRRLQQHVRDEILARWPQLEPDDVRSTSMGAGGEDIQLSPAARRLLQVSIECKAKAKIAVYSLYKQAVDNCPPGNEPVLVIRQDRSKALAVVDLKYLIALIWESTHNA